MKKLISTFLVLVMLMGLTVIAAPREYNRISLGGSGAVKTAITDSSADHKDMKVEENAVIAQYFEANQILAGFELHTASYGNNIGSLTFKIYQWKGSYNNTVQGRPIAQKVFENFNDNSNLKIDVPANGYTGAFLCTISESVENVAVWTKPSTKTYKMYVNGEEVQGQSLQGFIYEASKVDEQINMEKIKEAYQPIDLTKYDNSDGIVVSAISDMEAKVPVINIKEGACYASYTVDFGTTPPKGAKIRLYNNVDELVRIQIVADDIIEGEILCQFDVEVDNGRSFWETVPAKIDTELTGVHKIFLVTRYKGAEMASLQFLNETPEDSKVEKRLSDYEATKDFTLVDTYSDTWTATDMIGRKLPDYETAGEYNPDKQVGMFYWTWHSGRGRMLSNTYSVNQKVEDRYNGPVSDIKNEMHYAGWGTMGVWNESVYGIYSGFDEWVMRKQLELFAASGVDGLFFDATNGTNTWTGGYMELAQTMHDMHLDGIQTPGMSFMLPFFDKDYNVVDLERIYESMYETGLFSDTWYYWDGKPVIMGYPDNLDMDNKLHAEIKEFFTFRPGQPSYFKGPERDDHWPWLEVYPQNPYGKSDKYGCECVSVGIAQNADDIGLTAMNGKDVYGRSYTYKDRFTKLSPTSKYYGYNFQEQWDRAFELDPEFVFVTGWNEWTAGHYDEWNRVKGAYPDTYNDEYSRDIEPTKGEFKDTYYYQLAANIRKFKGVRSTPTASIEKTINLEGGFSQWADVGPEFIGYKGGTEPRDFKLNTTEPVKNYTGRNDIVLSKVARDSENLYFYVKTAENLTSYTDQSWMRLFINTDRTYKTGWEGYDYIINRVSPTADTATLEKWVGSDVEDWKWQKAADVKYTVSGNEMMIAVPRSVIGTEGNVDIEFKWNDNMQQQGDIMDFYNNGDTAPIGRYAYHYVEGTAKKIVDEPVDPSKKMGHITRRFIVMALDNPTAYSYGEKVKIDPLSDVTSPMIINDKTMVPVRFLAESLGAKVEWQEEKQTVKITLVDKRIFLELGSDIMKIEKDKVKIQSPAIEIENRIYVPLRDVVEAFGITCNWIDPGVIIVGPMEEYITQMGNGGIDKILVSYGLTE